MKILKGHRRFLNAILLIGFSLTVLITHFSRAQELLSNVDGKIRVVILHYAEGGEGFWFDQKVLFRDLFEKMDKDVGFVMLGGKDDRAVRARDALRSFESERLPDGTARLKHLVVDVKSSLFYPWARDPYFIQADPEGRLVFLDAGYNEKPFPVTTFGEVFAGARTLAGTVHRGGGNVRTAEEAVFIGMDTILGVGTKRRYVGFGQESYDHLFEIARTVKPDGILAYRRTFDAHAEYLHRVLAAGKSLVIPEKELFFEKLAKGEFEFKKKSPRDTGAQAEYHTDVYLGLGGKAADGRRVLFVADSRAGALVAEGLNEEARRAAERALAGVLAREGLAASGVPLTEAQIAARFEWEKRKLIDLGILEAKKQAEKFDKAAAYLEGLGFQVVRIPSLPNGLDDEDERNDGVVGVSFNYSNVLTEVYGNVRKVYLPRFGFEAMDNAAGTAYRSAGFEPVFIDGLLTNALSVLQAGLDCLTSEIRFPVRWAEAAK
jgi:hypothetical protein